MVDKHLVELPEGYVDFYKRIETWQSEVLFRLKRMGLPETKDPVPMLNETRMPIIKNSGMRLESDAYREAVMEFIDLVRSERDYTGERLELIGKNLENADFGELAARVLNEERDFFFALAADKGLPAELLWFVLDHALRPFLRFFALPYQDSLKDNDRLKWHAGICPVCGFWANFSRIRSEDGHRILFCEHCFSEWEYDYLGCIHCGNTEPATIRYFIIEGDDANQIFVCDKCHGYLKTFDERKGAMQTGIYIAGIETVYLDLIAQEEGYTNVVNLEQEMN